MNSNIYTDYSGDLREGYFYEFEADGEDDSWQYSYAEVPVSHTIVPAPRVPTDDELYVKGGMIATYARLEIIDYKTKSVHKCPLDKSHDTDQLRSNFRLRLAPGWGFRFTVFNCAREDEGLLSRIIVPDEFAKRLRATPLTGYRLERFQLDTTDFQQKYPTAVIPPLWHMQFVGSRCRRFSSIRGAKNACPFCGFEPMICPGCGHMNRDCPKCEADTMAPKSYLKGPDDKRLVICDYSERVKAVLETARWDGSDFTADWYITRRALDWLLSIHATPFYAKPMLVNFTNITDEKKALLERAKTPIGK